jgi:hypothetical protein
MSADVKDKERLYAEVKYIYIVRLFAEVKGMARFSAKMKVKEVYRKVEGKILLFAEVYSKVLRGVCRGERYR